MKRFIQKVMAWFFDGLKLALSIALGLFIGSLYATSGWHYGYHEGREMRCFCVRLPGTEEYTDWNHGPVHILSRFSMRAPYRIGPWIEPEWTDTPVTEDEDE